MAAMSDQEAGRVAGPLVDVPGPVEVLGVDWPRRPVLCIQPMTHGDARFAEGRRAGLLEAAAHLEAVAERLSEHGPISRMFSLAYHSEAENLKAKAGEP